MGAAAAAGLETEGYLQVDAAVGGAGAVGPAGDVVGLTEEGRTEIADGCGEIDLVESVSGGDGKREAIAAVGRALVKTAPLSSATAAAGSHSGAAERAASPRSAGTSRGRCFFCPAETKGLA